MDLEAVTRATLCYVWPDRTGRSRLWIGTSESMLTYCEYESELELTVALALLCNARSRIRVIR